MRIKRLEVHGFKSFKDKTVIHFDHGITGIVGPNGCGKSNIVDAFFWVMGEQSYKHMRGSNSQDLIFNGSSKYNPAGLAEATLVMEVPEVDTKRAHAGASVKAEPDSPLKLKEISVTRRVYRGGEGEYFINGMPARLRDIHELFMDTGVGAKGYSVIEQGQIDKVVASKPEERRLLIEEAAGIAKYKARKKESLRKMQAAEGNLSRLNDVTQEIERSLSSLERQAQKARKYKEYKEELFDKEMTWGRRKSAILREKIETFRTQKDTLEEELILTRTELQTVENTIETDRIRQLSENKRAEALQDEIQELSSQLTHEQSALELSRQRQDDLAQRLQGLADERTELEGSIQTEKEGIVDRELEHENSQMEYAEVTEQTELLDAQVRELRDRASSARAELESAKQEFLRGLNEASEYQSRSAVLKSRMESQRAQLEESEEEEKEVLSVQETLATELSEYQEKELALGERKEVLFEELQTQKEKVSTLQSDLRDAEKNRDQAHRELTQLQSRLHSLEELAAAHEGLGDGPKAVLDWAKEAGKTESFGVLTDLIGVTQGYENALEAWLDGQLESLFTSDVAASLEGLARIREKKQGRAEIYIESVAGTARNALPQLAQAAAQAALQSGGFEVLGSLSDFVQVKAGPKGEKIQTLLQGTLVVQNFESVKAWIENDGLSKQGGWCLISLDGMVLAADGSLRGGSTESDSSASVLGRKRAIQELEIEVQAQEEGYLAILKKTDTLKTELDSLRANLETNQAELQALQIDLASAQKDVHQTRRSTEELTRKLDQIRSNKSRFEGQLEEALSESQEIEMALSEILSKRTDLESQVQEQEAGVQAQGEELRREEDRLSELKIKEASLRERTQGAQRELESARSVIRDRERRVEEITRLKDRLSQERSQHTGDDTSIQDKIQEFHKALSDHQEELSGVKDVLEGLGATLDENMIRMKRLHADVEKKSSGANSCSIDVERLNSDLHHLTENLEEKYGPGCLDRINPSGVQQEMDHPIVTTEMSVEEEKILEEDVARLRDRIRRLGEVNTMAIEEYEELKGRYDHLLEERQDLVQSIENLQEAIEHINKTSRDRFEKAFHAIAERFERLFPIIFGGGKAKLSLVYKEDSDDILDSGVDILAQPPGKKIVNISLLSGGEKALTAVSLIFAIFMVKPSPFCLLDEVDAPLDDSNIGKFNALLREMSVGTQFILITHNKKTMELNDTLYGVTMEEPGVSKMVSIELQ
jgi:chromosome segregation protein